MNRRQHAWQRAVCTLGRFQNGETIWQRDWDIACILDGCRVDVFREVFDGPTEMLRSVASTSQTWIPRTFEAGAVDTERVGYISGNPFTTRLDAEQFGYFHVEPVTETDHGVETVPPEPLADRAIDVWRRRAGLGIDRLVVHFMQPHAPFRSRPEWFTEFRNTDTWGSCIWKGLADGRLSKAAFFDAYRDNVEWVLDEAVHPLAENCEATIALTADHGNAAGELGIYGHPRGAPTAEVRIVPWATIDGVDERTRAPDISESSVSVDVERQLAALGYTQGAV